MQLIVSRLDAGDRRLPRRRAVGLPVARGFRDDHPRIIFVDSIDPDHGGFHRLNTARWQDECRKYLSWASASSLMRSRWLPRTRTKYAASSGESWESSTAVSIFGVAQSYVFRDIIGQEDSDTCALVTRSPTQVEHLRKTSDRYYPTLIADLPDNGDLGCSTGWSLSGRKCHTLARQRAVIPSERETWPIGRRSFDGGGVATGTPAPVR